jgi:hypothetical protein
MVKLPTMRRNIWTFLAITWGEYPFRYLGIPMHHRKLVNSDWKMIEERFEKK